MAPDEATFLRADAQSGAHRYPWAPEGGTRGPLVNSAVIVNEPEGIHFASRVRRPRL